MTQVAVITGASRGIGKACALALARRGYRVVVTGRTLEEGKGTVVKPYAADAAAPVAVPGSVASTVEAIRAGGGEAMGVALDIMSQSSIDAMLDEVLAEWGRIDLLVNNAIYNGPGLMYAFSEFTTEQLEACLRGTVVHQVSIARKVLPAMLERGEGTFFFMGSVAGLRPSPRPVGEGGWGFLHGASKSAFHRIAEFLHLEHARHGIRSYLVEPQLTVTESSLALFGDAATRLGGAMQGYPPQVTGDVVAWLAAEDRAGRYAGKVLSTPTFFAEHRIAPG
jgi:NAD(P)-dependent dehydrogenase (short-subunit alcohol dehydrogenase family)